MMKKILLLLAITTSLSSHAQYPFTEIADHGPTSAIRPYYKDGKVCSYIKNLYPVSHLSFVEIDVNTLQYSVTRIDSLNTLAPSLWHSAFEIINFNGNSRRIAYPISQDSLIQVFTYDPTLGIQSIDSIHIPIELPWIMRAYSISDSLYLFVGRSTVPPNYTTQIILVNRSNDSYAVYYDSTGNYYMDLSQEVNYVNGAMEWYNGFNRWYRINGNLTIDTIQGSSPAGGTAHYQSAIMANNTVYVAGTFMEFSYPTVAAYLPEHHIQERGPNDSIIKQWYVPNHTGPVENAGHAYDSATNSHYLAANIVPFLWDPNRELSLSKVTLDNNQDSATTQWDILLDPENEYQNLGIVYANSHIFMLNRYYQAQTSTPMHEIRIFDVNGFELSRIQNIVYQVKAYPNPTSGKLIIDSPSTIQKITLYHINGSKQLEQKINTKHAEVNLGDLDSGTYILICHMEKGVYKQKVIVE